jgi:hypothetical protein
MTSTTMPVAIGQPRGLRASSFVVAGVLSLAGWALVAVLAYGVVVLL